MPTKKIATAAAARRNMLPVSRRPSALYYEGIDIGGGGGESSRGVKPSATDANIVIVTASLLVLLVSSLCLHFLIRWLLSRYYDYDYDHGHGHDKPGAIPAVVLRHVAPPAPASDGAGCAICLAAFRDGDRVRVLPPCRHRFHARCVDTWLAEHPSCPTCRADPFAASAPV